MKSRICPRFFIYASLIVEYELLDMLKYLYIFKKEAYMKKSKKIIAGLLALSSLCVMASCNENNVTPDPDPKPNPEPTPDPTPSDLVDPPTYDEDSISIHYYRKDRKFSNWALWLWAEKKDGQEYTFNGVDDYGAIAAYPISTFDLSTTKLGVIVKSAGSWSSKDPDGDRYIDFSNLKKDSNNIYHVYLRSGETSIYDSPDLTVRDEIKSAVFAKENVITLVGSNEISNYKLYENDKLIVDKTIDSPSKVVSEKLQSDVSFENDYKVEVTFAKSKATLSISVSKRLLYKTDSFSEKYNYDGELGAIYTNEKTTFKVWSPVSSKIMLRIYDSGTPTSVNKELGNDNYDEYPMVKGEKGVFTYEIDGDLSNKFYTYVVTNTSFADKEIVDPYAKSCGVNGLRGAIVDFSKTNPDDWDKVEPLNIDRKALTVYETHIADVTSSSTWNGTKENAKKYAGVYESGTTYTSDNKTVTTGFDHIKELGVNAVQLLPIFDQANDEINGTFNWGYNPLNYNCLEGIYSKNPYDAYERIREFKGLVQAYNKENINIIMDVVYNHVNGANGSNFDVLMPGYYFRYNNDGTLSSNSGCGNDTASDMYMYRKFMVDSISFWTKEYKLGGYRFDLMGLHDVETMNQVTAEAKKINPSVVIYGEPWDMTTLIDNAATQKNANKFEGYGQFNDQMRDALIKGGLSGASELGWVDKKSSITSNDDINKIINGIKGFTVGSTFKIEDPDKTVNYVTCHDNYTLFDRFMATNSVTKEDAKKMNLLANSVVFTSQGTTFMLSGEEFLRTKGGDHNSYQSSYAVNELNYSLKISNSDTFESYKKLIKFKQETSGMHLDKDGAKSINVSVSNNRNVISYEINDGDKVYKIIHSNGYKNNGENKVDLSGYSLYLDTIDARKSLNSETILSEFETIIAYKSK